MSLEGCVVRPSCAPSGVEQRGSGSGGKVCHNGARAVRRAIFADHNLVLEVNLLRQNTLNSLRNK